MKHSMHMTDKEMAGKMKKMGGGGMKAGGPMKAGGKRPKAKKRRK